MLKWSQIFGPHCTSTHIRHQLVKPVYHDLLFYLLQFFQHFNFFSLEMHHGANVVVSKRQDCVEAQWRVQWSPSFWHEEVWNNQDSSRPGLNETSGRREKNPDGLISRDPVELEKLPEEQPSLQLHWSGLFVRGSRWSLSSETVCKEAAKGLWDWEKPDSLVWWNQDWTVWSQSGLEKTITWISPSQWWSLVEAASGCRGTGRLVRTEGTMSTERSLMKTWSRAPDLRLDWRFTQPKQQRRDSERIWSRCVKVVTSWRLETVITDKGASTKSWGQGLNTTFSFVILYCDWLSCDVIGWKLIY